MPRINDTATPEQPDVTLDHPQLTALEAYWSSLRESDAVPARTALNPAKMEPVLASSFILQRVAVGTARFRVAGQNIRDLLRMDPRGMPFSTLFAPDARDDIRDVIEAAFSDPAIVGLPLQSPATLLRPVLDGAMLLLPMGDASGQVTRMLGAIVTPAHEATKPFRFAIRNDLRRRYDVLGRGRGNLVSLGQGVAAPKRPDTVMRPALKLVVNNG